MPNGRRLWGKMISPADIDLQKRIPERSKETEIFRLEHLPIGWCEYPDTLNGYRVNYSFLQASKSILDTRHNEVWMIWTDLIPCVLFLVLFLVFISSNAFKELDTFYRWMGSGIYLAVFLCRLFSGIYHIYNCVSIAINKTLINIDLIGICCMSFGSPWVFAVANKTESVGDTKFIAYLCVLFGMFLLCVTCFSYVLMKKITSGWWMLARQPLLVSLALAGNAPSFIVGFSAEFPTIWRTCFLVGPLGFVFGYVVFYISRFPECRCSKGAADGKVWNSHVIWHCIASIGQLFYVVTTFLPLPQ